MNLAFSFQASIIKTFCDNLAWQLRRDGGELDRLDGYIIDNNYVELTAANGLRACAKDLRKLADEIDNRAGRVVAEELIAAE